MNKLLDSNENTAEFQIPPKLYGREQEIETLLVAFERIAGTDDMQPTEVAEGYGTEDNRKSKIVNRKLELMLVSGEAGIGKSALVQEISKPVTEKGGYFIAGKFDPFQQNVPYAAVAAAFRDWVEQLLSEGEAELKCWQEKLLAALGSNGQIILDLIPEVELLIGPQPAVEAVGPAEAQNRFQLSFQNFMRVLGQPGQPLVIFLDDLQWVDPATLKLIELMLTDEETRYLLLIGTYQDNEVGPTHPLNQSLARLHRAGAMINEIILTPLSLAHLTQLMAETLDRARASVEPLARLVMHKTEGNPFLVNQFLDSLYEAKLLTFVPSHPKDEGGRMKDEKAQVSPATFSSPSSSFPPVGWHWDLAQIEASIIADNIVDFVSGKLGKLPAATQQVLRLAAWVGSRFDLSTLALVHEKTAAETFQDLWPALQAELILSPSALAVMGEEVDEATFLMGQYKFLHDQVRQAVAALMGEAETKVLHLKIGRLLLADLPAEARTGRVFELADHLNLGRELISTAQEKIQLAQLNLEAGQKAKASTAYAAARTYLKVGLDSLPEQAWLSHYDLTFALHKELAEVEYLTGNFERSAALINLTSAQAHSIVEKVRLSNLLIMQHTRRGEYEAALQAGRKALSLLRVDLPEEDLRAVLGAELAEVKENLGEREVARLLDEKGTMIPDKKAAMELLTTLIATAYRCNQALAAVIAGKMVNLSLKYGHTAESAYGYAAYGLFLGSVLGDYPASYAFGLLGLKLSEKFNNQSQKCLTCNTLANHIQPWVKPLKLTEAINEAGYQAGLASGQLPEAGHILAYQALHRFEQGENLAQVLANIPTVLRFSQKTNNPVVTDIMTGLQLIVLNLSGATAGQFVFDSAELSEAQFVAGCQARQSFIALCHYQVLKAQTLYLYGQPAEALQWAMEAEPLLTFIRSSILLTDHNFYTSLSLIALSPTAPAETQKQYWEKLAANQKQMKIWADHCPENFRYKYLLVAAEMARLAGHEVEAGAWYAQATASAHQHGFTHHAALAYELAAKFWFSQGQEEEAQVHLAKAYEGYRRWGARYKVEDLAEKYPHLTGS